MPSPRLRTFAVLSLSLAAHGALLTGTRLHHAPPADLPALARKAGPAATEPAARLRAAARIADERAALVASARADLRDGRLALGDFLLRANALDAEERGAAFDLEGARDLYRGRSTALLATLAREPLRDAVPHAFADLRYFGRPGGLMAEALFDRGGSCEQLSHLVAACAYDAGVRDRIALRYYGGATDGGAGHITAVDVRGDEELDLLTGRPAFRRGSRFPATDLIEVYARAHGLAPPLPGVGGAATKGADGARNAEPDRPSLTAGYPSNADRYPGSLPLYAARAVSEASDEDDGSAAEAAATEQRSRAHDCAFFVRMAALDPPGLEIDPGPAGGAFSVELRRAAVPSTLERKAGLLRAAEEIADGEKVDAADRLMAYACLAALSKDIAADFALAGERKLGELAQRKGNDAASHGADAIAAIAWDGAEGNELRKRLSERFSGQTWLLLMLDGGDRVVLDLARRAGPEDWGQVEALAALAIAPATRARAFPLLEAMPRRDQVDVMHEIFRAHDHQRPWASNYALDDAGGAGGAGTTSAFPRAYRVFRRLASRLWEGQRPVDQTLEALSHDVRVSGLDADWEALFLEYYGRNVLGLHQNRADGMDVVWMLAKAVRESGHPALARLRRRLAEIEASGKLDAVSLSDAWRTQ